MSDGWAIATGLFGFMSGFLLSAWAGWDCRNDWIKNGGFEKEGRFYRVTPTRIDQ